MLVRGDPEVPHRPLVPVGDPGHRDHFRADEPGPVAAALAAKGLHSDACHRREHEAGGDFDLPDEPDAVQVDLHTLEGSGGSCGSPRSATMGARLAAPACSKRSGGPLKEVILTAAGYEKLRQEIEILQTEKRREVAERIRVAREFGDIAENAEYDDAKNEQAMLEHKINQLEDRLLTARVITKKEVSKDTVSVGAKVVIRDIHARKEFEYHIVGSAEANPLENKLSNESPVGKAIMGHKKGDVVEVTVPAAR